MGTPGSHSRKSDLALQAQHVQKSINEFSELLVSISGAQRCWLDLAGHPTEVTSVSDGDPGWAETERAIPSYIEELRQDAGSADSPSLQDGETVARRQLTADGRTLILEGIRLSGSSTLDGSVIVLAFDEEPSAPASEKTLKHALPLLRSALDNWVRCQILEAEVISAEKTCAWLKQQVQTDALTGVQNTRSFQQSVSARLESNKKGACFILVDIDHFKRVNDVFGHAFGDKYLQSISSAIATAFPDDAFIGRVGGDEFAVLANLPDPGMAYMSNLLSRCRSGVQRAAALLGRPELGRISIGVSLFPSQASTYSEIFERADAALYAAKEAGRGATVVYQPDRHARFNNRELEKQFLNACRQNLIVPYFQPVVELSTGICSGFEVLARWLGPDGFVKKPAEFNAVLSDHRTAEILTRSMVAEGLDYFGRWYDQHREQVGNARLSINLTAFDLLNPEFVFELQSELSQRGLDWSLVNIEITENVILGDTNGQIHRNLEELRARGATLAMDDFGTGHGGLQHLRDWPIDILKIDRQFVRRVDHSVRDRAVVEAVLSIAERCGFEVVAEGIETVPQLEALRELGCGFGQGYLFSEPMPPDDVAFAEPIYAM